MRILISNDDGIEAKGIKVLEGIARQFSNEVTVVAPDSNMSGAGHSLTLKSPLRLKEIDEAHFAVDGTPTDSVVMALRHIMNEKPDFILSGINGDSNLADDITYSGTVAAAMEACLLGIPAVAFSQETNEDGTINWDIAKTYAPIILKLIMNKFKFVENVLLNINFPPGDVKDVKGIKITSQGTRAIDDCVIQSIDPRGHPYFWMGPADYRKIMNNEDLDTDLGAIHSGYVSITPLSLDMTSRSQMKILNELFAEK
ncbi:MAG: 5'/3'-nucleotidase SurE [Holosporales bacterium]|jgi:5'-nucleotidase|nr:5'/3'-nucleotidase SurE [Holosporales bacterium]